MRLPLFLTPLTILAFASGAQARQVSAEAPPFQIIQMATTNPEGFLAEWEKPTPGVRLETQTTARRGEVIQTFLIFKGCKPDPTGDCQVSADYLVLGPTGKVYSEHKGSEVWLGKPAPPEGRFELSASNMAIRFEPQDLLGDYKVRMVVTDHVSGVTLRTEQILKATN